jgi:hypothetical protein
MEIFAVIPKIFHYSICIHRKCLYPIAKHYSKTPQNGIKIILFGDPEKEDLNIGCRVQNLRLRISVIFTFVGCCCSS